MGTVSSTPPPAAPTTPDASDLTLLAARRARAFSIFGLGTGFAGNFGSGKGPGLLTYGQSFKSLLGGATQAGDETGQYVAPTAPTTTASPNQPTDTSNPFSINFGYMGKKPNT